MSGMIDPKTVAKIIDACDVVDVVSEFVNLRKAGVNYKGLCPFHNEKTPSFMVSPSRGTWHCFGCGKGGTAVGFVMDHEQMTYPEALRWLANKYHIEIVEKEQTDEQRQEQSERESMFIVNEWAKGYFKDVLRNSADGQAIGMQYFRSRGFRDDIIEKFQLGYDLPQRDLLARTALQRGYKEEFLLKTGLCYKTERGELIDRFAGRVMFPWISSSGKVCAFGGRLLDARTKGVQQKYVNSPESLIYKKERELYGIYQAKREIVKQECVFMVEGYTDVISMHQCGIENVVANSGTALSVHQIKMLHRFTNNIVLLYDGDAAGIHAAMRGTDMLLEEGMNIKVLILPDGDDPDSFARKHTAEEFRAYIEQHQKDFIAFKTQLMLDGVTDPVKRSEAINSIVKSVSVIPNPITRATYLADCSRRLGIGEQTLINQMNRFVSENLDEKRKERERTARREEREREAEPQPQQQTPTPQPVAQTPVQPANQPPTLETLIIQFIIKYGDRVIYRDIEAEDGSKLDLTVAQYIDYDLSQDNISFSDPTYNQILAEAVDHSGDEAFSSEQYFVHHGDQQIAQLAVRLTQERYTLSKSFDVEPDERTIRQQAEHLILEFRMSIVNAHLQELKTKIAQAGTSDELPRLLEDYRDTQEIRNALARQLGTDIVVRT